MMFINALLSTFYVIWGNKRHLEKFPLDLKRAMKSKTTYGRIDYKLCHYYLINWVNLTSLLNAITSNNNTN